MTASARSSSACTVRRLRWRAQPANSVPSYSTISRETIPGKSDQLEQHHLGRVRPTRPELEDPRVAAGALGVARRDLLEQLIDGELVLAKRRQCLATSMQIAPFGQRDQLLDLRLDGLGLGLGRLDPLVLDHFLAQVHQQRLAVRGAAAELISLTLMTHRTEVIRFAARGRGRGGSRSLRRSTSCRS